MKWLSQAFVVLALVFLVVPAALACDRSRDAEMASNDQVVEQVQQVDQVQDGACASGCPYACSHATQTESDVELTNTTEGATEAAGSACPHATPAEAADAELAGNDNS